MAVVPGVYQSANARVEASASVLTALLVGEYSPGGSVLVCAPALAQAETLCVRAGLGEISLRGATRCALTDVLAGEGLLEPGAVLYLRWLYVLGAGAPENVRPVMELVPGAARELGAVVSVAQQQWSFVPAVAVWR